MIQPRGLNNTDPGRTLPRSVPEGEIDRSAIVRAVRTIPVWVTLEVPGREAFEHKGFADGWTREHVLVQIVWPVSYFTGSLDLWVRAGAVRRRTLEPRWPRSA